MIRFIALDTEYTFKWEFEESHASHRYGDTYKCTHYLVAKLKGEELIDWLQLYGLTPDKMFKETNPFKDLWFGENDKEKDIDTYRLNKAAEEWSKQNADVVEKNPWTVVGMNGGYVLISNGSKENTVELGSASIMNLEMNNSNTNTIRNNPNISVRAQASLI